MALTYPRHSLAGGELAPSLWGRTDMAKVQSGCTTMRNCFVNYRGGASSRAGTAFVGPCRQDGNALPPRIIRFQFSLLQSYVLEFGDQYMRVMTNGTYVTETPLVIMAASNLPTCTLTVPGHNFTIGDTVYVASVGGMTKLNGRFFQVGGVTATLVALNDIFGNNVNSTNYGVYTSGGTVARIYTAVSPYAAADLPYLKPVQSADVMSLTCVNQVTLTEYPPYDLSRLGAANWVFTKTDYSSSIGPPTGLAGTATVVGTPATQYAYCVTAVDKTTGDESIASRVAYITNSVNIAVTAGSIKLAWNPVVNAGYYNIYKAPAAYSAPVPVGSVFGYAGTSYGNEFVDSNITQNFAVTPPLHFDPFARGAIRSVTPGAIGAGYTQGTVGYTITTATGSGAALAPVVVNGGVVAVIVETGGKNYQSGDTLTITDSGVGAGATFVLVVGAQSGTYPGAVQYFQSRRVYANTLNNPDTYFMSQTGSHRNMDAAQPPIDSDAITGNPWAEQVNGIQWMQPMPGGLIIGTGKDAWQLSGSTGPGSPVGPASQSVTPQEANGFSPTVPPIRVNYNVIHLQPLGATVRDIQYNFFANIYAGTDISFLSSHLLQNYQIVQWAWVKEPYKIIWSVRDDGRLLSLTYLKEQEILGWARHDTNGQFVSIATVSELPVDAVYFVVRRYIPGPKKWMYYAERMDDRAWDTAEDAWCVDCGLALAQPTPAATLTAARAAGPGALQAGFVITGGTGYVNPAVNVIDPTGAGSGAAIRVTVAAGVITGVIIDASGANYGAYRIGITDTAGRGGVIGVTINQDVAFTASAPVFAAANVGSVIRTGGGIATIGTYTSTQEVVASLRQNIQSVISNDPNNMPAPAAAGKWTMTAPVTALTNMEHMEGMTVTAVADGSQVTNQIIVNGDAFVPAASAITMGLPFTAQVQTLHFEVPNTPGTVQSKRKLVSNLGIRLEKSRGVQIGANQPVAAIAPFQPDVPWSYMATLKERNISTSAGNMLPLFTGDKFAPISDNWNTTDGQPSGGFVAAQQLTPFPMNVLAFYLEADTGDDDDRA